MYCQNCGAVLPQGSSFCTNCGTPQNRSSASESGPGLRGFSQKINDPAFSKYRKNQNRWALLFSLILAVIAVIGFFIAGETTAELKNPQALYYGLGIGGMFLLIGIFQTIGKSSDQTWDGTVIDKRVEKKRKRQPTSDDDYYWVDYVEYLVLIKSDRGKVFKLRSEDSDILYNYYQIGERVRHHKGFPFYEKYDKSKEAYLICCVCGKVDDIHEESCSRCKCPLLK